MHLLIYLSYICTILALDNGLARTPPMGWMSWTAFYCQMDCIKYPKSCINEELYKEMADMLVSEGYSEAGYVSVHVDDCWMGRERNNTTGKLIADKSRFPSGIRTLARYMHGKGLKFGIYEDYGTKTCAGFPGSYGYLKIDADTFAEWEVDYLKLDGCNIDISLMPTGYPEMGEALNTSGRSIVYSCSWPAYMIDHPDMVDYNLIAEHCNLWRNFDDINSSWKSIMSIVNYYDHNQDRHIPIHGPGQWHDPDMLVIGNPGITVNMAIAQMTIWSIWSAPLIMSNDLRILNPEFKAVLLNRDVIAVDQDSMGKMGRLVANTSDIGVYVKPVTPVHGNRTSFAVGILNRNMDTANSVEFILEDIGLNNPAGYEVKELWSGQMLGIMKPSDVYKTVVPSTGAAMFKATLLEKYEFPESNGILTQIGNIYEENFYEH